MHPEFAAVVESLHDSFERLKTAEPIEPGHRWPREKVRGEFMGVAKNTCGGREFCQVHIWESKAAMARGFPMTDMEVAAERFTYGVNRNMGFEQGLWDCTHYPSTPRASCVAKD